MVIPSSNMSEELETNHSDKDGFIKCKVCSRRFFTKIGLKIHSRNQHKESDKKVEQLQVLPRNKEEIAVQQNTGLAEKYPKCILSFESKIGLQGNTSNDNNKLTPYQCIDFKKSFRYSKRFEKHIQKGHKGSKTGPFKSVPSKIVCPDCNKYYGSKASLQMHIIISTSVPGVQKIFWAKTSSSQSH